jgi:imidazole glycerol-phosphate synthase subunit HisH
MKVVIIQYNSGNVQSVQFALNRIGAEAIVSNDEEIIRSADKVIFPGVGEAGSAMQYLKEWKLDEIIKSLEQPVLGICLGMQLMCRYSEEGSTQCLGIFEEAVKRFVTDDVAVKVPQIGWNTIAGLKTKLFAGLQENSYCYFVHSYYAAKGKHTIATTDYIQPYSAALQKDNFYGVQFHPEKSAEVGELILTNFLRL